MRAYLLAVAVLACSVSPAVATTKGLNQIVTPDIQPPGQLSISFQRQDGAIGNPNQLQLELGLTKRAEIALFQGLSPSQTSLHAEVGLVQTDPWLLSVGFSNWSSGNSPQFYTLGGWYHGGHEAMAGAIRVSDHTEAILGYAYQLTPRLQLAGDYQSGPGNSLTAGFTYSLRPDLSLNPALYLTNDEPRRLRGYVVLTWSVQVFK